MEASAKDTMTETEKERQTVNKTLKGELAKLKEMTWGQKAEYIWDYYKFPIIITICVLIVVGSLINHYLTRRIDALFGMVVNAQCQTSDQLDEDLNTFLRLEGRDSAYTEANLYLRSSASFDTETKISCYIAARTLDYAIGDEEVMELFGQQGMFLDLEKYLPADLYEYFKDNIILASYTNEQTKTTYSQVYLKLNDYAFFDKYAFYPRKEGGRLYLGIVANAPHLDNTIKMLEYIRSLGTK